MAKTPVQFTHNGREVALFAEGGESLLSLLRLKLGDQTPKYGCGQGGCGACTVEAAFREGGGKRVVRSVNACLVPVLSCDEWDITTVEGVGGRRQGLRQEPPVRMMW